MEILRVSSSNLYFFILKADGSSHFVLVTILTRGCMNDPPISMQECHGTYHHGEKMEESPKSAKQIGYKKSDQRKCTQTNPFRKCEDSKEIHKRRS